jgi:hypothetical protein
MSDFSNWFKKAYKRWSRSQPGEEDFLGFCELLGYPPYKVLSWLHDEIEPQGAEILSIAGILGYKIYEVLALSEPDPELVKIYNSFSHLSGDYRSKLALALWEADAEIKQRQLKADSEEMKIILTKVFKKWGLP